MTNGTLRNHTRLLYVPIAPRFLFLNADIENPRTRSHLYPLTGYTYGSLRIRRLFPIPREADYPTITL